MILPAIPAPQHPPGNLTPAQRAGLRYQRRVGKWLRTGACAGAWDIHDGPWLQGPHGPVQPDFVLTPTTDACAGANQQPTLVVLETKLTQVDCARQLAAYRWALRDLGRVVAIQVCRRVVTCPTVRRIEDLTDGHMLLWI